MTLSLFLQRHNPQDWPSCSFGRDREGTGEQDLILLEEQKGAE